MRARIAGVVLGICFFCQTVQASPIATWPPEAQGSASAPVAKLERRMVVPPASAESVTDICLEEQTMGLVGWTTRQGEKISALWRYDLDWGMSSLCYEAPAGVQIVSPVLCQGDLYFVLRREDQAGKWEIMVHRGDAGRVESIRTDATGQSTVFPYLRGDGTSVYWYESRQSEGVTGSFQAVDLHALTPGELPQVIGELNVYDDWTGPCVSEGIWAAGVYDAGAERWSIVLWDIRQGQKIQEIAVEGMPVELQMARDTLLWRQGEDDHAPGELNGVLEEEGQLLGSGALAGGRLMRMELPSGTVAQMDRGVETARLWADGVVYTGENGMLFGYGAQFGGIVRLSPFADYTGVLRAEGDQLLALRTIWTGEEILFRLEQIHLAPLAQGWPEWM